MHVELNTIGKSCANWERSSAKRAYLQCAASLTGQPRPIVKAACMEKRTLVKGMRLAISMDIPKTGTIEQAQGLLDGLVTDIRDGTFSMCMWTDEGVTTYRPRKVVYSKVLLPENPRPAA